MIGAPIFHVNGDDPEACVWVARLAVDFRQKFKKDVVIDMLCYRRRGHNEGDDPSMTQPSMYDVIDTKRGARKTYTEALIGRGDISIKEAEDALRDYQGQLEQVFNEVRELEKHEIEPSESVEAEQQLPRRVCPPPWKSRCWRASATRSWRSPTGFTVHPRVKPVLEKRREMAYNGKVDWAFGELLALGSSSPRAGRYGSPGRTPGAARSASGIRWSSTARRARSSPRCSCWPPTRTAPPTGGRFMVYDSPLSEFAAVGFEYGYSVGNPDALVLWEAQFGDFVNGAQSVIDEFISSGEAKWGQMSDVVLLLPHGHEGQGPDHTSGRIERFLQLCAEGSMTVAKPSTPANYFHLLRRHALDGIHRPLIVFTPKSMLRNKAAVSDLREFTEMKFRSVIEEPTYTDGDGDRSKVKRILLTSGKIYYELAARKAKDNRDDVAIVRIEQLAPLPKRRLAATLDALSERRAVLLGAGGAGQPGRVAHVRADAARAGARSSRASSGCRGGRCRRRRRESRRCTPSNSRRSSTRLSPEEHRPGSAAERPGDHARAEHLDRQTGEHGGRAQRQAEGVGHVGGNVGQPLAGLDEHRAHGPAQRHRLARVHAADPRGVQRVEEVGGAGVGVGRRGAHRRGAGQPGADGQGRGRQGEIVLHTVAIAAAGAFVTAADRRSRNRGYRLILTQHVTANARLSAALLAFRFDRRPLAADGQETVMEGFAGKVAVVTGAGSGIGQALAIELGRSGAKLAISDVDTEGLAATEERLTAIGSR